MEILKLVVLMFVSIHTAMSQNVTTVDRWKVQFIQPFRADYLVVA